VRLRDSGSIRIAVRQAPCSGLGYRPGMPIPSGEHTFGPDNATLKVLTLKGGAASKAGHNLTIEVGSWNGNLIVGDDGADTTVTLSADSRSLRVLDGTGGVKSLTDDDKADIKKTIDKEVLKGCEIEFKSTSISGSPERLTIQGELGLAGHWHPLTVEATLTNGRLNGTATVKQSAWGIKPYSALFGALKVLDEVQVVIDGAVPS
jgi:polyisoprenoid-binding protein YceI